MIEHTLGVVLIGGASRRMGTDKASIEFDGSTLLERSVDVLAEVFTSVVISGGDQSLKGVRVLPDLVPGLGPLGGLDTAYRTAAGRDVFLLAVDMPFVDASTVRVIADPPVAAMSVRVPVAAGRRQPLCAVYGSGLGPIVRDRLEGKDRSMESLFGAVNVEEITGFNDDVFTNVNTQNDLDAALKRT
ncbi:MAG: molybdenum cofactor guanylyltransferase, partial [Actinomycetota bacterium]